MLEEKRKDSEKNSSYNGDIIRAIVNEKHIRKELSAMQNPYFSISNRIRFAKPSNLTGSPFCICGW